MREKNLMSACTMKNDHVKNLQGQDLGRIKEFMIDANDGRIEYAVLSYRGLLGEKLFAIPWDALELDKSTKTFKLNADKEKLRNSPGFHKDHWPEFADATFLHNSYRRDDRSGGLQA